jgi:hypothetical protein
LAQNVKLTLNCQYESVAENDGKGLGPRKQASGSFSAIVLMMGSDAAFIDATTAGCFDYVGSFTDLQVTGDCERTTDGFKVKSTLIFDRYSGEFDHTVLMGKSLLVYGGHLGPAKKLF